MAGKADENRMLEGLFLRDKPSKILLGLNTDDGPVYATLLSKEADCTYSHTIKILNSLKDLGLVSFEKKGRIKKVKLTEAGSEIARHMEKMVSKFIKLESGQKKAKKARK